MDDLMHRRRPRLLPAAALAALLALAACTEKEFILPGEREGIRPPEAAVDIQGAPPPLRLPASRANADWTHLNGDPTHLSPAVALSGAPRVLWTADIGEGSAKRQRLSAAPVVANGVVYTMDVASVVTAVSTSGRVLWRSALAPPRERPTEGFGGGLAAGDGALVVTTGYGEVLRLDPAGGAVQWRTAVEGPVRAAPTLADGRAMVVARGDLAYGIDLQTGAIDWRLQGLGEGAGLYGGASPAVRGPVVIFPFVTGEVRAALVRNGLTVWSASITGGRRDEVRSLIKDISGDPVIDFDVVYAANQAGRLVALDRRNGERIWTQQDGSYGPALPVGDSVFLVTDAAEVIRVAASDGRVLWRQPMPEWIDPARRKRAVPHFGPLLAGGRLIVASGDGVLRSFDPTSGRPLGQVALPGPAAAHPAIAGGVLYVVTGDGRLVALG
ncbi:PQQ-binding-like beta-propeller repeat protein [Rhodobacteraceae bacterium 2CG4]|uniref:PQQ-binding-like beta-propeller repeat protein n=1 Tax=Halovulum marinum TaxID=2662447 RepID=A0A6L5YXA9_9RHOB|nr:PQQ-binding-like beta-propeller repeat protein [Halovulum marinum]MSU88973.1 PQQ-binding-like beta-propeller repeat protein [Halovulum marinum]